MHVQEPQKRSCTDAKVWKSFRFAMRLLWGKCVVWRCQQNGIDVIVGGFFVVGTPMVCLGFSIGFSCVRSQNLGGVALLIGTFGLIGSSPSACYSVRSCTSTKEYKISPGRNTSMIYSWLESKTLATFSGCGNLGPRPEPREPREPLESGLA
jgi:hypothetical protein